MFLNLLRSILKKPLNIDKFLAYPEGKRIYKDFHGLRRDKMDPSALKVLYRLNQYNYRSYIVGGCLRDMLIGKRPKDFDIATRATPEQIRKIFTNSRSIGRRFRIVHIIFRNQKIIEVSTFRSLPKHRYEKKEKTKNYFIQRDNRFGSLKEDVARRDFTMNALFFDHRSETIIDYVDGYSDIQKKCVRVIGDPSISFCEDPIRMLRAAKFVSLLNFSLDYKTKVGIRQHKTEIRKANPARLLDELIKIFKTGKTAEIFSTLEKLGLLKSIFPEVHKSSRLDHIKFETSLFYKRLEIADRSLAEREELTIVIFLALIIADRVKDLFSGKKLKNKASYIRKRILPICRQMSIPTKDRERLFHIFISYSRLEENISTQENKLKIFRDKIFFYEAFMFFKIYSLSNNNEENIQKSMFWEIGPRKSPPEKNKTISTFSKQKNKGVSYRKDKGAKS